MLVSSNLVYALYYYILTKPATIKVLKNILLKIYNFIYLFYL